MDHRLGKVGQTAGMVEIQMGQHNMPNVFGSEAQLPDLGQRRIPLLELDIVEYGKKTTQPPMGMKNIAGAKTGVNQHQPVIIRFDQQAVADQARRQPLAETIKQRATDRTHATAVQMMNSHWHILL